MREIPNLQKIVGSAPPRLRRPVPDCWREAQAPGSFLRAWAFDGLRILLSVDTMEDRSEWLHVSFSRATCLPSWDDLCLVKDIFIGRDHEAVQVLPKSSDYVNCMPYCLHLWSPE